MLGLAERKCRTECTGFRSTFLPKLGHATIIQRITLPLHISNWSVLGSRAAKRPHLRTKQWGVYPLGSKQTLNPRDFSSSLPLPSN